MPELKSELCEECKPLGHCKAREALKNAKKIRDEQAKINAAQAVSDYIKSEDNIKSFAERNSCHRV